jgi:hypothetical protein
LYLRWQKGTSSLKVQCEICDQVIDWHDTRHIETHTPRELVVAWITHGVFLDEERAEQFYLYNLRKIVLLKTDIDPRDMLKLSVLKAWLAKDGIPEWVIEGWLESFE